MVKVQIDDLFCECDNSHGIGEYDTKIGGYTCLRCGLRDSRMREFRELQIENDKIRAEIGYKLSEKDLNNHFFWKQINELIENEIELEGYANG